MKTLHVSKTSNFQAHYIKFTQNKKHTDIENKQKQIANHEDTSYFIVFFSFFLFFLLGSTFKEQ